jgi:Holliday junction resolvase
MPEVDTPEDLDRLIQEALVQLGAEADAAALARKVAQLNLGLPAEDEVSVICAWLGRCRLVHKLDQLQAPTSSRDLYQVPDLLADFNGHGPVLIEVKASRSNKLSFSADYHRRLTAYATLIGKPLLIAWKWQSLWILFDIRAMKLAKTNFNITYGEAMRQNLLGALVGDVMFKLSPGAGVRITLAKEKLVTTTPNEDDTGFTEEWKMRVTSVDFLTGGGVTSDLHAETIQILVAANLEPHEAHFDDRVEMNFVVGEEGTHFAHMALIGVLGWERRSLAPGDWRSLLRTPQITRTIENFAKALNHALGEGVVTHIFHQQPAELPDFMIA